MTAGPDLALGVAASGAPLIRMRILKVSECIGLSSVLIHFSSMTQQAEHCLPISATCGHGCEKRVAVFPIYPAVMWDNVRSSIGKNYELRKTGFIGDPLGGHCCTRIHIALKRVQELRRATPARLRVGHVTPSDHCQPGSAPTQYQYLSGPSFYHCPPSWGALDHIVDPHTDR